MPTKSLFAKSKFERVHQGNSPTSKLINRLVAEYDFRTLYEKDCYKLKMTDAYRRLSTVTQVSSPQVSGLLKSTRLTHTNEVAEIGTFIAKKVLQMQPDIVAHTGGLDIDVVRFGCLGHDIGHPPFGHAGEHVLSEAFVESIKKYREAEQKRIGESVEAKREYELAIQDGFEGNAQSFRVITHLIATRLPQDDESIKIVRGMNVSRASVSAILKYPWFASSDQAPTAKRKKFGVYRTEEDKNAFDWVNINSIFKGMPWRTPESEVMDFADDVAYSVGDFLDGIVSGMITPEQLKATEIRSYFNTAWDRLRRRDQKALNIIGDKELDAKSHDGVRRNVAPKELFYEAINLLFEQFSIDREASILYARASSRRSDLIALLTGYRSEYVGPILKADQPFVLTEYERKVMKVGDVGLRYWSCARRAPTTSLVIETLKVICEERMHPKMKQQNTLSKNLKPLFDHIVDTIEKSVPDKNDRLTEDLLKNNTLDSLIASAIKLDKDQDSHRRGIMIRRLACDMVASMTEFEARELFKELLGL